MSTATEEKLGTLKISDDVIAVCARNATLKTKGVADLSSVFSDSISKNIFGKEPLYKGIKVNQNDEGISIDIYIVVEYGVKIQNEETDTVFSSQNNYRKVEGVIVASEGAGDIVIKNNIISAVATLFDIPASNVVVYEKIDSGTK
ncbi:MAG TPA: Asp23/Gls24 family envelope stress response protein [Oculatellaceae cyanobacterium]